MKYTIKNCPAYYELLHLDRTDKCCGAKQGVDPMLFYCKNQTDCLLKQIVEKCKENQKPIMEWNENGKIFSKYGESKKLADEILGLLEIEVIEE